MIYFHNIAKQNQFERDGYTIIDLLSIEKVNELKNFYFQNKAAHLAVKDKMHSTCDTNNLDLILKTDEQIQKLVLPEVEKHLSSFTPLFGSFLVKEAGKGSETGFHQDPTLVDKAAYVSANIWISLQDTFTKNGNLTVVKGSHRLGNILVATPKFPTIFEKFRDSIGLYATELPVKAGQAIVLNNKLIHGATPNLTNEERIATIIAVKSEAAAWSFFFMEKESDHKNIEKFTLNKTAFANLVKNKRPELGKFEGLVSHDFPQISFDEFKTFMHKNYQTESPFNKIKRWWKNK